MPPDSALIHVRLDKPLHLTARGAWLYGGEPFTNIKVAQLFSRSVIFDPDLNLWLVAIGSQRSSFTFEDTPIFVEEIDDDGLAHFTSRDFAPIRAGSYGLRANSNGAWYLVSEQCRFRSARLLPSLQQRLSGLVSDDGEKAVVELPTIKIEISDEQRRV